MLATHRTCRRARGFPKSVQMRPTRADAGLVFPVIQIDYLQIFALFLWMGWFVKGARMDLRSPVLWGALSLGMWLLFSQVLGYGLTGGLLSQLLLIGGLAGWEEYRERRRQRPN